MKHTVGWPIRTDSFKRDSDLKSSLLRFSYLHRIAAHNTIGDYGRALYGVDRLIKHKEEEKRSLDPAMSTEDIIRDREELSEQIRALDEA